jgi:hypothetical protein
MNFKPRPWYFGIGAYLLLITLISILSLSIISSIKQENAEYAETDVIALHTEIAQLQETRDMLLDDLLWLRSQEVEVYQ